MTYIQWDFSLLRYILQSVLKNVYCHVITTTVKVLSFISPKAPFCPFVVNTLFLLHSLTNCSFAFSRMPGKWHHIAFCLLPKASSLWRFIYVVCISTSLLLLPSSIAVYEHTALCSFASPQTRGLFRSCWSRAICVLDIMFLFLLVNTLAEGLLGYIVSICLRNGQTVFWSVSAILYLLSSIVYLKILALLIGLHTYFIFLVPNVKHLFKCL